MDIEQLKKFLQRYNLKPNFTYGQNFLLDDDVLEEMLTAAEISAGDTVLEVGPGIGNLTRVLLDRAGFVFSVEKDPACLPILKSIKRDYRETFRYEIADILEYDFGAALRERPEVKNNGYKVVANIPYYITGKILQLFLTSSFRPASITVLAQKEVARNATAPVGELSMLALSVQMYGDPRLVRVVPRESFYPAPKVDSAILHIDVFGKPKFAVDEKVFFRLVRACFAGKRKQIHNTLKNNLKLPSQAVSEMLGTLGMDPKTRPQDVSLEQWVKLAGMVPKQGP